MPECFELHLICKDYSTTPADKVFKDAHISSFDRMAVNQIVRRQAIKYENSLHEESNKELGPFEGKEFMESDVALKWKQQGMKSKR